MVRPEVRRANHSVGVVVLAVLVVLAILAIGGGYWLLFSHNRAAKGEAVAVSVAQGSSTPKIAAALQEAGVIDNAFIFRMRVRFANADSQIKAGLYSLVPGTDYDDLIKTLEAGPPKAVARVTIPEGKTLVQTAAILAEKLDFAADDFVQAAKSAAPDYVDRYSFLAGAYDNSLEGFLFPDTYEFELTVSPKEVISVMLARFSDVWATLDTPAGGAKRLTAAQLVTVASLVEREASVTDERPLVSSVIYNRLSQDMRLQLCSSVQFLLPGEEKSKLRLTNADLQTVSPYNTYRNKGLPPGPIANPGKGSLDAALHPAKTKYLYFVLTGKDGSQTFAATLDDFAKAKEKSKQVFGQ